MQKLTSGSSYLVKRSGTNSISKIQVFEVTKTCYKIKFEGQQANYMEQTYFHSEYKVIEQIDNGMSLIFSLMDFKPSTRITGY